MKSVSYDFRPQRLSLDILYIHNQFAIKSVDWPIFTLSDSFFLCWPGFEAYFILVNTGLQYAVVMQ
jgi:hypothetical protein